MQIYEEFRVMRLDGQLAGFVRCTDDGWQWSADGLTFAGDAPMFAQVIPLRRSDYRLVAESALVITAT